MHGGHCAKFSQDLQGSQGENDRTIVRPDTYGPGLCQDAQPFRAVVFSSVDREETGSVGASADDGGGSLGSQGYLRDFVYRKAPRADARGYNPARESGDACHQINKVQHEISRALVIDGPILDLLEIGRRRDPYRDSSCWRSVEAA